MLRWASKGSSNPASSEISRRSACRRKQKRVDCRWCASMGRWLAEGCYAKIAEKLFNELRCDRLLLEYDDPRAAISHLCATFRKTRSSRLNHQKRRTGNTERDFAAD